MTTIPLSSTWQQTMRTLAEQHGVVGASLAVATPRGRSTAAVGLLNVRTGAPVTPASVFQVGSITKVWTAALVMQLVDEGLVGLDDPLRRHLPGFAVADEEASSTITVRQLLSHSSGVDGDLFLDTGRGDDAVARYVEAMAGLTQLHRPGASMSYSNACYTALGHLVATLRGATWEQVVTERLLAPLGLDSAGCLPEDALLHAAAVGHLPGPEGPVVVPQWAPYRSAGPAGLLHSTAEAQLDLAQALLRGGTTVDGARLLSSESAALMATPQVALPDTLSLTSHWGLGWFVTSWDGEKVIGHDGGTPGQNAFLRVLPERDVVICLLTNGGDVLGFAERLVREVLQQEAGVSMPTRPTPPERPVDVDPAAFTGVYEREGSRTTITHTSEGFRVANSHTGPMAAYLGPVELGACALDATTLLAEIPGGLGWLPIVRYEVDGRRYLHSGNRATPCVSDTVEVTA